MVGRPKRKAQNTPPQIEYNTDSDDFEEDEGNSPSSREDSQQPQSQSKEGEPPVVAKLDDAFDQIAKNAFNEKLKRPNLEYLKNFVFSHAR